MFDILKLNRRMMKYIGLDINIAQIGLDIRDTIINFALIFAVFAFMVGCFAHFLKNMHDFLEIIEIAYTLTAYSMMVSFYLNFVFQKCGVKDVLAHLESIVAKSERRIKRNPKLLQYFKFFN